MIKLIKILRVLQITAVVSVGAFFLLLFLLPKPDNETTAGLMLAPLVLGLGSAVLAGIGSVILQFWMGSRPDARTSHFGIETGPGKGGRVDYFGFVFYVVFFAGIAAAYAGISYVWSALR
jgi:hypothetical protein